MGIAVTCFIIMLCQDFSGAATSWVSKWVRVNTTLQSRDAHGARSQKQLPPDCTQIVLCRAWGMWWDTVVMASMMSRPYKQQTQVLQSEVLKQQLQLWPPQWPPCRALSWVCHLYQAYILCSSAAYSAVRINEAHQHLSCMWTHVGCETVQSHLLNKSCALVAC